MIKTAIVTVMLSASASAFAAEMPSYFRVRNVSYAGTACPFGSVTADRVTDASKAKLWFETVTASNGPGVPLNQRRLNCQLNLDLDYPADWQAALVGVKAHGGVRLPRGASAQFRLSHYLSGAAATFSVSETVNGPTQGDVVVAKAVDPDSAAVVWTPCGTRRALNVNMQVQVSGSRNATAAIPGQFEGDLDVIPGPGDMDLIFAWKRCR